MGGAPNQFPQATGVDQTQPAFWEAFWFWLKLGLFSFGGPAGQISLMHQELVEKRRWISEERFFHALNYCMLLPGPEAQQLATYIGWVLHKTRGGLAAGILFVLPAAVLLWGLSWIYVLAGKQPWMGAVFYGLKPAVLAMVVSALVRIGRKTLKNSLMWAVALGAFVLIYFFHVPFPLIILAAGGVGFGSLLFRPGDPVAACAATGKGSAQDPAALPSGGRFLRTAILGLTLWWTPVALARVLAGADSVFYKQGVFFSKAAMVTFGGAYAVLPYVSQQAVETFGWLGTSQMVDGLAFAESTPGPLIIVLEFVGFLGAWNAPGTMEPLWAATLGALMTLWCTFAPSFLWIFLGAPYVERLHGNAKMTAALAAVTAAVVGVILNLACWFGREVLFREGGGVDVTALLLALGTFLGIVRWKWTPAQVILGAGAFGAVCKWLS
jgi:chromate transporter